MRRLNRRRRSALTPIACMAGGGSLPRAALVQSTLQWQPFTPLALSGLAAASTSAPAGAPATAAGTSPHRAAWLGSALTRVTRVRVCGRYAGVRGPTAGA